ncbi:hypothetical protein [Actinocorallia aurea]
MNGFWSGLAGKLAERWLTLLVLPGVLYLAVATAAHKLGWAHALDLGRLTTAISAWAKKPAATTTGGQVVLLSAILLGAAAIGLAAQALNGLVERLALALDWHTWPPPLRSIARRLTRRRQDKWDNAHTLYHQLSTEARHARRSGATSTDLTAQRATRHSAYRERIQIGLERPDRPTWSGDRIHAAAIRLDRDLHINLTIVWPYLWAVLPQTARNDLTTSRRALTQATTLTTWALLYLPLTLWWWPALPIALGIAATGWQRTRAATDTHAQLLEATTRLHLTTLSAQLGIPHPDAPRETAAPPQLITQLTLPPVGRPTPALGDTITHHLHTQPPPPRTL